MRSKINIALLTPGFPPDERDTTSMPALQLYVNTLRASFPGISISIITFQFPFRRGSYSWNGIPVYSAGGANGKLNRLITWIRVLKKLFGLYRRKETDLVHAFWLTETALVGSFFCRMTGIPFLATAMGQDVKEDNHYLRILRIFHPRIVVISAFQARMLEDRGIYATGTIPFGIDPVTAVTANEKREPLILGVGSLNKIKNYPEFIRIAKKITERFPAFRFKIIGEGAERSPIEKMIRENALDDRVSLTGSLDRDQVVEEMSKAQMLLHTSRFEGQGLVVTEALAAGLYVVCHPVGIAADLRSEKLLTGVTTGELEHHLAGLINLGTKDHSSEVPIKIEETCSEYLNLYRSLHDNQRK